MSWAGPSRQACRKVRYGRADYPRFPLGSDRIATDLLSCGSSGPTDGAGPLRCLMWLAAPSTTTTCCEGGNCAVGIQATQYRSLLVAQFERLLPPRGFRSSVPEEVEPRQAGCGANAVHG